MAARRDPIPNDLKTGNGRAKRSESSPWPVLADEARQGLVGEALAAIEPHSEADSAAILMNLLTAFGNAAGRGAFVRAGGGEHHLNLFCALVGETSKARKGTSWGPVKGLMRAVDSAWEERPAQPAVRQRPVA